MKQYYTTNEIGKICNVYPSTVINWIKEGKLTSFTTPGGHRRVTHDDLINFLQKYRFPIPADFSLQDLGKKKILIVDDDPDFAALVKMLLESENEPWKIVSVNTGFGAGAKVFEWHPDLILLDFLMPDLDGYEVCRLLRENPKMTDVPIIALTALKSDAEREKIYAAGVTDYLPKPFKREELIEKVKTYLSAEKISHS